MDSTILKSYNLAKEKYAKYGVDTEKALNRRNSLAQ